jgi:hypothetical protein
MVSIVLMCFLICLVLPLFFSLIESRKKQLDLTDDGYWTLSRALLGGSHIKWLGDPNVVVWFEHEKRQCRIHSFKKAGDVRYYLEGRVYLDRPIRFASRLCQPHQAPTVPTLSNLEPSNDFVKNDDYKMFSIETTDTKKLNYCLDMLDMKSALKDINKTLNSSQVEIWLLNTGLVIRMLVNEDLSAGDAVEKYGPQLSMKLRELSDALADFSYKLKIFSLPEGECLVSAVSLRDFSDLWECPSCHQKMSRSAMELMKGCFTPHCDQSIDGVPLEIIQESSAFVDLNHDDSFHFDTRN